MGAPNIRIAAAHPTMVDVLAVLFGQCFDEPWDKLVMARIMAMPGAFGLLALAPDGSPVGFLLARRAAHEAEILSLGVLRDWRRSGIARALVAASCHQIRDHGGNRVSLEVARDNAAALRLYENLGFRCVTVHPAYYRRAPGVSTDAQVMSVHVRDFNG